MWRTIGKIGALCAAVGLAFGCAHTRITWQEFGADGKPRRAGSYYSSRDLAGKLTLDPATGVWTIDLTSTASTASAAQGAAISGVVDAAARAAAVAASETAKGMVKP
jgi:hypothetical protein